MEQIDTRSPRCLKYIFEYVSQPVYCFQNVKAALYLAFMGI